MKKIVFLFCCLLCIGFSGRSMAAVPMNAAMMNSATVLSTVGTITAIDDRRITVQGEGAYQEVTLNINHDTYINDGRRGRTLKLDKLEVGDSVSVFYGPAMTRSIPPQGNALAVIRNSAKSETANASYIKVGEVSFKDDAAYVVSSNGDLIVRLDRHSCRKYKNIEAGDDLLVWYEIVTLSMPGQTNADKAVILEHKCDGSCNR